MVGIKKSADNLCAPKCDSLYRTRMAMFKNIIDANDLKVVEMLCNSGHVLEDLMDRFSNLHDALSSSTPDEPEGVKLIADINPKDGKIDPCEWSEYLKAIYPFTLYVDERNALALNELKPSNELANFLSWDQIETGLCNRPI